MEPQEGHAAERVTKDRIDLLLQALLFSAAILLWRCGAGFFIRDEWELLDVFRHWSVSDVITPFHGQFVPLFKCFYRCEVAVFGVDGEYYLLANVVVLGLLGMCFFRLLRGLWGRWVAFGATLFLLVNPTQHELALWAFQVGVGLHLACATAAVLLLLDHIQTGSGRSLAWSVGAMVAQNYVFANGLLLPVLYIGAALLWEMDRGRKRRLMLLGAALLVLFMAVQLVVGSGAPPLGWGRLLDVLRTVVTFTGLNSLRLLFLTERPFGAWYGLIGSLVLAGILFWGARRRVLKRPILLFGLLWLVLTSVSVPLARLEHIQEIGKWQAYYSALTFPALVWLVFPCLWSAAEWGMRRGIAMRIIVIVAVLGWGLTAFMVDTRLVHRVAVRSVRNEAEMNAAIRSGGQYRPFDDPYFTATEQRVPHAIDIYRYWCARDVIWVPVMKPYPNDLPVGQEHDAAGPL